MSMEEARCPECGARIGGRNPVCYCCLGCYKAAAASWVLQHKDDRPMQIGSGQNMLTTISQRELNPFLINSEIYRRAWTCMQLIELLMRLYHLRNLAAACRLPPGRLIAKLRQWYKLPGRMLHALFCCMCTGKTFARVLTTLLG